jgi:translation initiation factor 1 (eIF-1/SUI1)
MSKYLTDREQYITTQFDRIYKLEIQKWCHQKEMKMLKILRGIASNWGTGRTRQQLNCVSELADAIWKIEKFKSDCAESLTSGSYIVVQGEEFKSIMEYLTKKKHNSGQIKKFLRQYLVNYRKQLSVPIALWLTERKPIQKKGN